LKIKEECSVLNISWHDIEIIMKKSLPEIKKLNCQAVYGIPRGGLLPALLISHRAQIPLLLTLDDVILYKKQNKKVLLVDEISDSGKTLSLYKAMTDFPSYTLYTRKGTSCMPELYGREIKTEDWLIFPWEEIL
jgi:hypoxanthine phosphoribosyltransferase